MAYQAIQPGSGFYWGTTTGLEPLNFEVQVMPDDYFSDGKNVMPNGLDCNPAHALLHVFLTRFGCMGLGTDAFDMPTWQAASDLFYSEGRGCSLIVASANTGSDVIAQLLKAVNAILYQEPSTGKILIKPLRHDYT